MAYRVAGIDVHKRMLAVAVADVGGAGEVAFDRQRVGTSPSELRALAAWLVAEGVEAVVMESTAQYWRPVWAALEQGWQTQPGTLHLAQAQSNRGPRGRKQDFRDAERLVKRLAAHELTLSFVPEGEQRLWRTVMRRKYQLTRSRVQLQNRLECLLEEAHLKLSSLVSDLLGSSARRMLHALATGATDPVAVAALGSRRLRATPEQRADYMELIREFVVKTTAKRLGARVEAFDTRPTVAEQVRSLGARFVEIDIGEVGETEQGYAKALTPEQIEMQQEGMKKVIAGADVVITTAQVFGRPAPRIVSREMIEGMQPGSVVVDMAVESGGNVEGSVLNRTVDVDGVAVLGQGNLSSAVAQNASEMYAANLMHFIDEFWDAEGGSLRLDPEDDIVASAVVVRDGSLLGAASDAVAK